MLSNAWEQALKKIDKEIDLSYFRTNGGKYYWDFALNSTFFNEGFRKKVMGTNFGLAYGEMAKFQTEDGRWMVIVPTSVGNVIFLERPRSPKSDEKDIICYRPDVLAGFLDEGLTRDKDLYRFLGVFDGKNLGITLLHLRNAIVHENRELEPA